MKITESKDLSTQTFVETAFNNDLSVRQSKKGYEGIFTRMFGDRNFIKTFWRLLLPSLVWGFITSLVPLLFNVFTALYFPNGSNGNMYLAINYTYGVFSTFNALVTVFLFAVFPVIGNFITRGHFNMMRQTIRWAIYVGVLVGAILMIFEQIFAKDMMNLMVWSNTPSGNQTTLSVNFLRFMSFISFFYLWAWLYVPTLSSIRNTKAIFYSAFLAFVFFIIATPVYLHSFYEIIEERGLNSENLTASQNNELTVLMNKASIGLGAIYLAYFAIQPLFLYFYCRFIVYIRKAWFKIFNFYYKNHPELLNRMHYEKELLFMDRFNVSIELVKRIFKLSWCIIIDQLLFSIVSIIQLVFIINYGGELIEQADLNNANTYLAGAAYYKTITSVAFEMQTFLFGIFNAFTIAPQYFVANQLGLNNKKQALRNQYLCINWSIVLGLIFMCIMFACTNVLNISTFPKTSSEYEIYINATQQSYVSYTVLYNDSTIVMYIFSGFMVINTVCSMLFFVMIEGGSKYTALGDSIIQIIFTIILLIMYVVHYNNMYWYYSMNQFMLLFKTLVSYSIVGAKKALNSIEYLKLDEPYKSKLLQEDNKEIILQK